MLCYRDQSYCSADCAVTDNSCGRQITAEVRRGAQQIKLPIATMDFSSDCSKYVPIEGSEK